MKVIFSIVFAGLLTLPPTLSSAASGNPTTEAAATTEPASAPDSNTSPQLPAPTSNLTGAPTKDATTTPPEPGGTSSTESPASAPASNRSLFKRHADGASSPEVNLYHGRLGVGALRVGGHSNIGPEFGLSFRWEKNHLGIEVSPFEMMIDSSGAYQATRWGIFQSNALYILNPGLPVSVYAGGGLGLSLTWIYGLHEYSRLGFDVRLLAGIDANRGKKLRWNTQLELILPTSGFDGHTSALAPDSSWSPIVLVRAGFSRTTTTTLVDVIDAFARIMAGN